MITQIEFFDLLAVHGIKPDAVKQFDIWRDMETMIDYEDSLEEKYESGYEDGKESRDDEVYDLEKERDDYIEQNGELIEKIEELEKEIESLKESHARV